MSAERNQRIRELNAEYLKLRWKINRYEGYLSVVEGTTHKDRIKRRLDGFRVDQNNIWDMLVELHS